MDLKEVITVMLLADEVRWLLKTHAMKVSLIGEDKVTDQMVEVGIDGMESLLKLRALVILGS